jgi:hypothetical protein
LRLLETSAGVNVKKVNVTTVSTALTNLDSILGKAVNNLNTLKTPPKGVLPLVSGVFGGNNQANVEVTTALTTIIKQLQTGIAGTNKSVQQEPPVVSLSVYAGENQADNRRQSRPISASSSAL